jgi:multicomponent Na+:H+ antiporter subunit G
MNGTEIAEWIGGVLVVLGGIFMMIGSLGLVRMPDVFTRMHAASVADTLGVSLILFGLVLFAGFSLVSVKLILLILFIALTSPTATHAVARAARHDGVRPIDRDGQPIEEPETEEEGGAPSKP